MATHIWSHNITNVQDIVATNAFASKPEANGKPFLSHKLPTPPPVKKEPAGDIGLMRRTFATLFYRPNMQSYNRIRQTMAKWIVVDCLLYRMMSSLDLKCPDFGRKAITSPVGHRPEYCSVLPAFPNMFFPLLK